MSELRNTLGTRDVPTAHRQTIGRRLPIGGLGANRRQLKANRQPLAVDHQQLVVVQWCPLCQTLRHAKARQHRTHAATRLEAPSSFGPGASSGCASSSATCWSRSCQPGLPLALPPSQSSSMSPEFHLTTQHRWGGGGVQTPRPPRSTQSPLSDWAKLCSGLQPIKNVV